MSTFFEGFWGGPSFYVINFVVGGNNIWGSSFLGEQKGFVIGGRGGGSVLPSAGASPQESHSLLAGRRHCPTEDRVCLDGWMRHHWLGLGAAAAPHPLPIALYQVA